MVKLESMKPKSKSWGNPVWCLVPPHATTCELDRYPSLLLGHSRPSHKVQVPRLLLLSGTVRRPVFHFSLLSWIFPLIYQVAEVWTSMKSEHLKGRLGAYFHRLPPSTLVKSMLAYYAGKGCQHLSKDFVSIRCRHTMPEMPAYYASILQIKPYFLRCWHTMPT